MPKVTEQYTQARRQQIIDAAYRCLAVKGFHETTMRDIYEEAGLSAGAVYHYFQSKDDIIAASFGFDYERSIGLFDAAMESDDPARALGDLLVFLFTGLEEAAGLGASRVNVQGWGAALVSPPLRDIVTRVLNTYRESTTEIIRAAQAKRQVDRKLDAVALSNILISLYYGLELQLALDPKFDVEGYAAAARELLERISRSEDT
jgi:AcrR family transcriptional regulator